jgi:hypothetical protein
MDESLVRAVELMPPGEDEQRVGYPWEPWQSKRSWEVSRSMRA